MRLGFIVGSLVGAVAIHAVFVACSSITPGIDGGGDAGLDVSHRHDGNVLDAILDTAHDVAVMVRDAEIRDAHADGGMTCNCPAPARPTRTFSGSFGVGAANMVRARMSQVTVAPNFVLRGGTELAQWNVSISFYLTAGELVGISCSLLTNLSGQPVAGTAEERCSVNVIATNGTNVGNQSIPNATATAAALTNTGGTITLPNFSAGTYRSNGITVLLSEPEGGLLTPPSAYVP